MRNHEREEVVLRVCVVGINFRFQEHFSSVDRRILVVRFAGFGYSHHGGNRDSHDRQRANEFTSRHGNGHQ